MSQTFPPGKEELLSWKISLQRFLVENRCKWNCTILLEMSPVLKKLRESVWRFKRIILLLYCWNTKLAISPDLTFFFPLVYSSQDIYNKNQLHLSHFEETHFNNSNPILVFLTIKIWLHADFTWNGF